MIRAHGASIDGRTVHAVGDVVRDAIKRHVSLIQFEQLRRDVLPFAEARGYLTDEDVINNVS